MKALESLSFIYPELLILTAAFAVLIWDWFTTKKSPLVWLSLAALVTALMLPMKQPVNPILFSGFFILDPMTQYFRTAIYVISGLVLLAAVGHKKTTEAHLGEFCFLLLSLSVFLVFMAGARNLLMIFLSIESVSVTSYLLVAFQKYDRKSPEAALKYLLFGAACTAVMLFGISLIFGATQTIHLTVMTRRLAEAGTGLQATALFGFLLLLTGIGFKISMVPFHMWAPDVYEGASTPVAAFLTVAPKALGFAVLIRVVLTAFPEFLHHWQPLLAFLAILTMSVGNLLAIVQQDMKRLLAYSSVAQAGYILAGVAAGTPLGVQAVLIYVVAYLFTNLGAFFTVLAVERSSGLTDIGTFKGLSQRNPFLAAQMTVFLLSLGGIPPLAGFIGKLFIFAASVHAGLISLAVAIALNSAVAAYYYFRIVKEMYLTEPAESDSKLEHPFPIKLALALTALGVLIIGLFPASLIQAVQVAAAKFFQL